MAKNVVPFFTIVNVQIKVIMSVKFKKDPLSING